MNTQDSIDIVTTAIPYVNAAPHLGFALETVITDVLARHRRLQGHPVFHSSGTDDNSLKNARAAERLGVPTKTLVDDNAAQFQALAELLSLSWDGFVRTSGNPIHQTTVEEIWRRCAEQGDIYTANYEGLYCVGCEHFYTAEDLLGGCCPEHLTRVEEVQERNYFFRLSRYGERIRQLIVRGHLQIVPDERRNEVLAFLESGLEDVSVSRTRARARGWGLAVPGDPSQVIYVWFDALVNYISALGSRGLERWQRANRIEHVIGKGIVRFHGVYWPAILLAAGLRLPTRLLVHGYLTVESRKIGKALGNAIHPSVAIDEVGVDAVRYFLLRHVPTTRDGDFTLARLRASHDNELADQLGNLIQRTAALVQRYRGGAVPARGVPGPREVELAKLSASTDVAVVQAVESFALHEGLAVIWRLVAAGNRYVDQTQPWKLGKAEADETPDPRLDCVLNTLVRLATQLGFLLRPFLPTTAREILRRFGQDRVEQGPPLFPKQRVLVAPPGLEPG